jgi:hypothetical protein
MFRQVLLMGHVAAPSTGPGVSNLRLNSLDPSWFGACPPKTVSAAACRNGREVLGLPLTGIRLSWEAIAGATTPRGTAQVKFEAQITHLRSGQVVWTSGAVSSAEPFTVAEPQPPLLPETSYSAQVRVWLATPAEAGVAAAPPTADPTAWSLPALFDTRPDARSWSGSEWIGGHNQLRGELTLPAGAVVERARLYAIGLGAFVAQRAAGRRPRDGPATDGLPEPHALRCLQRDLLAQARRERHRCADRPIQVRLHGRVVQPHRRAAPPQCMPLLPAPAGGRAGRRRHRHGRDQRVIVGGQAI